MEVLSKNKHIEYPQKIFEEGLVTIKKEGKLIDYHRIAVINAHAETNYTEIRQTLDFIMNSLRIKYEIIETEHESYIPGRVGRVIVEGKKVGYIGEIAPQVISNFDITVPVVGMEINLTELLKTIDF